MKKINDLKTERADLILKMEAITVNETVSEEQRTEWEGFDTQIKNIDSEIALLTRQEELNKNNVVIMEKVPIVERKPSGISFREWVHESVKSGGNTPSFRADPILVATDSGMINKTVAGGIDVLTSPGESFLRQIGAAFFTGLTGNLCLNSMAQDLATFPGENTGAASANMAPAALTLAARRLTHTQSISKETLAQTNPAIYASILQNLQDGMWNAIVKDYFTTIESDGVTDIGIATGSTFTYADALNLEAAIGMLNIGPACYVTTPAIRAQMKKIAALTNQAAVWLNNTVNGYPAYCTPGQKATYITFGDFSKAAVAQWGGFEVIIDPFTDAKKGLINLTIVGLVDTGCFNTRGLANVAIA